MATKRTKNVDDDEVVEVLHARHNRHDERLSRMEARQEATDDKIDRVVDAVDKLAASVHRPNSTQWGWVISGASLFVTLAFGFTVLITSPIKEALDDSVVLQQTNNARQEERINKLEVQVHEDGERSIRNEAYGNAHFEADKEMREQLLQMMRDVDLYGSRRRVEREEEK